MPVVQYLAVMSADMPLYPLFQCKSRQSQFGDSTICAAVAIQQTNLSLQSQDRFVHQLQFTGSLTGKVQ